MACRIAVFGALGRMGKAVAGLAAEDERFDLVQLLEAPDHPRIGSSLDAGNSKSVRIADRLEPGADVLVDFSTPAGFRRALVECVKHKTAFVSGTTGLGQDERDLLVDASSVIPCLHAPNMSIGVEVLCRLAAAAAGLLPSGFDVEIVEIHHNRKADAPSGTALKLAQSVQGRWKAMVHGREGAPGPRSSGEIGVHAVRGGDVVGEHTVYFFGRGERIELVHKCTDRSVFAAGALEAALGIAGRKGGLLSISDVLPCAK